MTVDIVLYENIQPKKIKWLLEQEDLFCNNPENVISILTNLLKSYKINKKFKIVYKPSVNYFTYGRLYGSCAVNSNKLIHGSLGSLPRHIRGFLADDGNIDIDIKRCHWYILKGLLKKYVNENYINNYLDNYDELIKTICKNEDVDKLSSGSKAFSFYHTPADKVKNALLSILNTEPNSLSESKKALLNNYPVLLNLHSQIYISLLPILKNQYKDFIDIICKKKKKEKENLDGCILSNILQDIEKNIIVKVLEFFESKKFKVSTIIHDGLIIYKSKDFSPDILKEAEKYIYDILEYPIELVIKPFLTGHFPEVPQDFDPEEDVQTSYSVLCDILKDYVIEHNLRKDIHGNIYKKSNKCPLHYELLYKYDPNISGYSCLIEDIFKNNKLFNSNPAFYDQMKNFIEKRNIDEFLNIIYDSDIIGFNNSILNLRSLEITCTKDIPTDDKRIVRHFIDSSLDINNINTKTFDDVLKLQLQNDEAVLWYYILLGRTFFPPHNDDLQVNIFIKGIANTGKSLQGNIALAMHRPGSVGTIQSNQEQTFGVDSFLDKELIIGFDIPQDMKNTISVDIFKSISTGESVNVPRKNKRAITVPKWNIPIILIGNYYPNYEDKGGSISKRLAIFEFNTPIPNPDSNVENIIIKNELPSIIYKAVKLYKDFCNSKNGNKTFNEIRPDYFKLTNENYISTINPFLQFLENPDIVTSDYIYSIEFNKDYYTTLPELNQKYEKWCKFNKQKYTAIGPDNTIFSLMDLKTQKVMVCKNCRNHHVKDCCDKYTRKNRTTTIKIIGMKFIKEVKNKDDYDDE